MRMIGSKNSASKVYALLRGLVLTLLLVSGSAAYADDDLPNAQDLAEAAAKKFPQPVRVGDLIGRRVLQPLESQPTLGFVREVVKEPDGTIAVVMDYGGWFGFFSRPIAVNLNAMVVLGQFMEVAEYEPEQLAAFPTFDPKGTTPLPAGSIVRVGLGKPAH